MKKIEFVNKPSLREFEALPENIQKRFGADLAALQNDNRPFSRTKNLGASVGRGAIELIKNGRPGFRVIYVAKYKDTIYILHSFTKTTNGVDRQAMETAKKRYQDLIKRLKK